MGLERRNVIFHIDVNSAFLSWEGGSAGKSVCCWR